MSEVQESDPGVMAKGPLQSSVKWFRHALTCILGKVLLYNPDYLFGRRCFWRENRLFPLLPNSKINPKILYGGET